MEWALIGFYKGVPFFKGSRIGKSKIRNGQTITSFKAAGTVRQSEKQICEWIDKIENEGFLTLHEKATPWPIVARPDQSPAGKTNAPG